MFTREASSLDLFTDSVRLMGDATLCSVMEFEGRIDPAALEEAAQACLLAHPILHSRLVRGQGPAEWEMADDIHVPPIQPEECADEYHPLVICPVIPSRPLQFRVRLLRRPRGDIVVINLAHAAADGFALHVLSSQLLREYDNPGSIAPAEGGLPERDTLWTEGLGVDDLPACPDMKVINPLWPDPFGTSRDPSSFHRDALQPAELDGIRRSVRQIGGTVNDAVMAAYYLTLREITGHREVIDIFFPVNLRQHLRDGSRVMTNQSANVSFPMTCRPGEGLEEILPRVVEETRKLKAQRIGVREQVEMDRNSDPGGKNVHRMVEEMAALQESGLADIFISNPGEIALPDNGELTDAYLCYPGGYMPTTCFLTSTFRGKMTFTMGYQDSERPREGTRRAMQLFRQHLLSLLDG